MSDSGMRNLVVVVCGSLAIGLMGPTVVRAHCDTMDGPVAADARAALEKGDVAPVLKWVQADKEDEIRRAFQKTLVVRTKGPEAKELADMYFLETLVRVHRAGEGAPYTGLKPAGMPPEPGVAESDEALKTGDADPLVKAATEAVAEGIRHRFAKAAEAGKHAGASVEAGRQFVAAYVEFVHYVERIFADAMSDVHAHGEQHEATTQPEQHHEAPAGNARNTEHDH